MIDDTTLLAALDSRRGQWLAPRAIAAAAGIDPGEHKLLQRRLRDLARAGTLEHEGRRYRLPRTAPLAPDAAAGVRGAAGGAPSGRGGGRAGAGPRGRAPEAAPERRRRGRPGTARGRAVARRRGEDEIVGSLTLRREGYGFVKRLEGPPGDDVFLPPHELREAMDGDRVRVRIVHGKFGRDAGELLEVVSHRRRSFLGIYGRRGKASFVTPIDPTLPRFVPVRPLAGARVGQVVKVAIVGYPSEAGALLGKVERVVGEAGDPLVEVLEVAYANGFAEDFPTEVRDEAEAVPDHVTPGDAAGRRDLTGLHLVTIDGADARDFDDAVYVERLPRGGYRLVVAIADVAHYVRPGTALDDEALARATSVYFPNHVLPMLPERLSNGICSLNPAVERLCMVCDLALDAAGKPVQAEIYEGRMRSHARCTYGQVAQLLAGETPAVLRHVEGDLLLAGELAKKLREQRVLRGALDFDLPEARAVLDETMHPIAIERRERNDAHRLVEEFMLAANEAVARYFSERGLPTVFRVHAEPDPEKLENFARLARAVGFSFDVEEGVPPARIGELLREIEGSPQQRALNTLLLRSMMQAVYQPENIGHYGLAAEHYLHFTSPIRRYPDLIVHRLLKEHWSRGGRCPRGRELEELEERLEAIAAQSSERERAAVEAEREIDQYFKCLFVQDRVGERFAATVIAVTDFGFFAELDDVPVEGLVKAEELGTSWELDEERYRLVFPATGRSFGMGDHVSVEIAAVDLGKRQISLVLVADQEGEEVLPTAPEGRARSTSLKEAIARAAVAGRGRGAAPGRRPAGAGRAGKAAAGVAKAGKATAGKAKAGRVKSGKAKAKGAAKAGARAPRARGERVPPAGGRPATGGRPAAGRTGDKPRKQRPGRGERSQRRR